MILPIEKLLQYTFLIFRFIKKVKEQLNCSQKGAVLDLITLAMSEYYRKVCAFFRVTTRFNRRQSIIATVSDMSVD